MNKEIKELEQEIQKEIWRLQMCDYVTEDSYITLHQMQKELKELKELNLIK
jgi:phage-related protein